MRLLEALRDFWQELDNRTRLWCGYTLILLLIAALGWSTLAGRVDALEKKRKARETVLTELMPLKMSYRTAKQSADLLAGRMASVRPDDTPAKIIEEAGIKGKSIKIVPGKGEERNGVVEDVSDVRIEGMTFNEVVNLVYRLEKGSRPLVMKKCNIRVRFDDPSRCDLAMVVALLKPAPGQPK